ncbi:MAG TPA: TonB-dependent receptor [Paludibaculum sp.]
MGSRAGRSCLITALALACTSGAMAQSVVVTGSWAPLPLEEADRSVVSLPARSQNLLLNTFVDLLKLDPSLDLQQRAPNGLQGDLSIRGATFGQTLVLLNGHRLSDPQSGHHSLDLPIPLQSIQSIEVLRGAGSTLYGSDALGGVVNVISAPPETSEIRLRVAAGNFGVNQQSGSLAAVRGALSEQLTFSRDFSSGFMPNRDYRNLSLGSGTAWRSRLGTTGLDLGLADKPFGAQGFYGAYPSWERTKTWFAGLRQSLGERTEAGVSYRRHSDLFYLFRDNPQRYQNHHVAESWQASLRRHDPLRQNITLFYGAEGTGEKIESSNLGRHSRARVATYASLDVRALGRFSFSAGVRSESYRGAFDEISPTISAGYWAASKLKFRAAVSRAYRLPTFTELYYRDPANQGNAALLAERAWSYEGGADYRPTAHWRLQTTLFHRQDRNGIDYMSGSPSGPWVARNIGSLNFTGVEGSAALQWRGQVLDWSYTGLRGVSQLLPGVYTKYSFNYPVHSGVFSWTANLPGSLTARTRVGAAERRGRGAYAVWDLYLARARGPVRPFVQFTNLSNARYQEILTIPMPGRAIVGGVELVIR